LCTGSVSIRIVLLDLLTHFCLCTDIHKAPSLNAANAWMMRSSALIAQGLGDNATAAMLRAAADKLSALVRSKLYVGGDAGGFWACEQPDGRLVQVRHIIDFISIGASVRCPPCQLIHAD